MDPRHLASLIAAAGLGALAMYVLDPQSGRRRVSRARDRTLGLAQEAGDAAGAGWRELRERVSDLSADVRQRLHRDATTDRELEERVRAELGRWVTHPHAVHVRARDGAVVLSGCVLAAEQAQLQRAVEGVNGVVRVALRFAVIDTPDGMPPTQGDRVRAPSWPPRPADDRYTPVTQLVGVTASAALLGGGMAQRGVPGLLLSVAGIAFGAGLLRNAYRTRLDGARRVSDLDEPSHAAPAEQQAEQSRHAQPASDSEGAAAGAPRAA